MIGHIIRGLRRRYARYRAERIIAKLKVCIAGTPYDFAEMTRISQIVLSHPPVKRRLRWRDIPGLWPCAKRAR